MYIKQNLISQNPEYLWMIINILQDDKSEKHSKLKSGENK